jgi:hypothetical protein
MLKVGKRLLGPILQFNVVAPLGVSFKERDRAFMSADLHGIVGTLPGRPSDGVHSAKPFRAVSPGAPGPIINVKPLGDRIISRQWNGASDTKGYATIEPSLQKSRLMRGRRGASIAYCIEQKPEGGCHLYLFAPVEEDVAPLPANAAGPSGSLLCAWTMAL